MRLIREVQGNYVNADKIEAFAIRTQGETREVVGYAPSDGELAYVFAETSSKENAQKRLDALADWLVDTAYDIFDCTKIWESDLDDE